MTLDTKKVKEYLNNLYDSDYQPKEINNYINILSLLQNNNYYQHFSNIDNFSKYVTNILHKKIINEYSSESSDKDHYIDKKYFTKTKILFVYNYLHETNLDNKKISLNKINKCYLYPKYKKGDDNLPENYRFLTDHQNELKLLDRIYSDILSNIVPDNFIDQNIFKASVMKKTNFDSCCNVASTNTETIENVVLLDVSKAFDSVEWNILYDNIINILSEHMSSDLAKSITDEYFILLQNRDINYRMHPKSQSHKINVKKSISQGLPSSNMIFTIFLISIVNKWKTKLYYSIDNYCKLNIYIDDFYIKFIKKCSENRYLLETLINELKINKLFVNDSKSLADNKLELDFNELKITDKYLGIPFTRDIQLYQEIILCDYQEKHCKIIKQYNLYCTWNEFYDIIIDKNNIINKHIVGYLKYKLKPLMYYHRYIDKDSKCTDNHLIKFIKDKLISNNDILDIIEKYHLYDNNNIYYSLFKL